MGRKAPSETAWRRPLVIVAAVLGTFGIGLAALKVFGAGSSNTCTLSDGNYRLAKFYDADGKMDMVVHADQSSEELMLAAKNGGNSPASLFHNFYKTEVCANQTHCSGVVLDIGASIGTHALYLAKLGYEVHAFEPQKNNTQMLRCSANAMGFRNLYVVQEGQSDICSQLCMFCDPHGLSGAVHGVTLLTGISDHVGTECLIEPTVTAMHLGIFAPRSLGNCSHFLPAAVSVVSLDHYWINVLGKRQISFIKIDTEAHELYVLLGGTQLFAEMPPPMMLMEWYPKVKAGQKHFKRCIPH
ncbi:methyltransf_21 domain-containing protein [Haematococcus lacustris]|uniref:Methyltransf_21 domain-containing protein n=1 Tax=Haematococcus lacustris TaxID=44745 RepID=A0A6A0A4U2_HAELA|nr:methyltransf_21 domain-containing protein [Haematococcus lacustris]